MPFGSALPQGFNRPLVRRVMASRQTTRRRTCSTGRASKRLITTVNVPVALDGGRRYVLAMALSTDHFNQLITLPNAPQGWLIAIIDDKGRFIARSRKAAELVGKPARPELVAAARARAERADPPPDAAKTSNRTTSSPIPRCPAGRWRWPRRSS